MSSSVAKSAITSAFKPIEKATSCDRIRALGNSHSLKLVPMLKEIGKAHEIEVISKKGPDYISIPSGDKKDLPKLDRILSELDDGDLLILSNRNFLLYQQPYISGAGDFWGDLTEDKERHGWGLQVWLEELDQVIYNASQRNVNVVLFLPLPEFSEPIPHRELYEEEWFRNPLKHIPCAYHESLSNRFSSEFFNAVQLRELNHHNFYTFDPMPFFRDDSGNYKLTVDGVVAYNDTHHISTYGSMLLLNPFYSFLITNKLL
jgi:hypothetical protein